MFKVTPGLVMLLSTRVSFYFISIGFIADAGEAGFLLRE